MSSSRNVMQKCSHNRRDLDKFPFLFWRRYDAVCLEQFNSLVLPMGWLNLTSGNKFREMSEQCSYLLFHSHSLGISSPRIRVHDIHFNVAIKKQLNHCIICYTQCSGALSTIELANPCILDEFHAFSHCYCTTCTVIQIEFSRFSFQQVNDQRPHLFPTFPRSP